MNTRDVTTKPYVSPPKFSIYVTVPADPKIGTKGFTSRIGTTNDEGKIKDLIREDVRAMGDTMGGLIEPVSTKGRRYRAFRAEWTEVKI